MRADAERHEPQSAVDLDAAGTSQASPVDGETRPGYCEWSSQASEESSDSSVTGA